MASPLGNIEDIARAMQQQGSRPSRAVVRQHFSVAGRFRVYFNRHQAAPLVWCVSLGDVLELAVACVEITAPVRTVYGPKATPDDEDGKPSAWLEVDGTLTVDPDVGTVRIHP